MPPPEKQLLQSLGQGMSSVQSRGTRGISSPCSFIHTRVVCGSHLLGACLRLQTPLPPCHPPCPWEEGFSFLLGRNLLLLSQVSESLYFSTHPQPNQQNQGKGSQLSWEKVSSPSVWGQNRPVADCPTRATLFHCMFSMAGTPVSQLRPQPPVS